MPEQMRESTTECSAWTESHQQIKAEHGGRQHDGQRADGLDKNFRATTGKREPVGQRHGNEQQDHRRDQRQANRQ